jgi:hypothetical protein
VKPAFESVWEVSNLNDLEKYLAICEEDFMANMCYDLPEHVTYWTPVYLKNLEQQLNYEYWQAQPLSIRLLTEIEESSKEGILLLQQLSQLEAIVALDHIQFPSHGVPRPANPIILHQNKEQEWEALVPPKRNRSTKLREAFARCLRRCIYFLLQTQLEKYWLPPPNGLRYARSYLGKEVGNIGIY